MTVLNKQKYLIVIIAGVVLTGCGPRGPKGAPQRGMPEVGVVTIKGDTVELTSELPGRTAAYRVAEIRPQVSGIILSRPFEEGSMIKEGDLLYQVDPAQYQASYNHAKAAVALSEASLPAIRSREKRYKELVASKAIGEQDYDDALAALNQAEAQLEYSKAALEIANVNLSYTPIKAPISGRIGRSSVTEGAMVTAYQPVPLATVQQLDPIYVDVPQSTVELLRLQRRMEEDNFSIDDRVQDKVKIILEDGSTYPQEGTLEFRDISVNATTGSVILRVVVPNPDNILLPGMFVRAVIREGILKDAILVLQSSVSRNAKGEPFVWVVDPDGKAVTKMISVERAIGDKWLVSSGLNIGDRVIVDGIVRLQPGIPVKAAAFDPNQQADHQSDQSGPANEKK